MAEADVARATAAVAELSRQQGELDAALSRQHAFADLVLSATLSRLAAIGLRIVSGESDLADMRQQVTDLAVKLKLIEDRCLAGRKLDADREAREQLDELASRRAWQAAASLRQAE